MLFTVMVFIHLGWEGHFFIYNVWVFSMYKYYFHDFKNYLKKKIKVEITQMLRFCIMAEADIWIR